MDGTISRAEHEEFCRRIDEENRRQNCRIELLEENAQRIGTLTAVFLYLSVAGRISGEQFLTIFSVVVAFYFGTQYQKGKGDADA